MPDTISQDTPKRGVRAINVEEWATIMTKLYRIIELELGSIEKIQNKNKNKNDAKALAEEDRAARRMLNAVRAVQHVHGVNKDVEEGEAGQRVKEALHESDEARVELDHKLQRLLDARKSRGAAGGDQQ